MTPARYCPKCGAKTVLVRGETDFDHDTGKVRQFVNVRCPNYRWWKFIAPHYIYQFGIDGYRWVEWILDDSPEMNWWNQGEGSK